MIDENEREYNVETDDEKDDTQHNSDQLRTHYLRDDKKYTHTKAVKKRWISQDSLQDSAKTPPDTEGILPAPSDRD